MKKTRLFLLMFCFTLGPIVAQVPVKPKELKYEQVETPTDFKATINGYKNMDWSLVADAESGLYVSITLNDDNPDWDISITFFKDDLGLRRSDFKKGLISIDYPMSSLNDVLNMLDKGECHFYYHFEGKRAMLSHTILP